MRLIPLNLYVHVYMYMHVYMSLRKVGVYIYVIITLSNFSHFTRNHVDHIFLSQPCTVELNNLVVATTYLTELRGCERKWAMISADLFSTNSILIFYNSWPIFSSLHTSLSHAQRIYISNLCTL